MLAKNSPQTKENKEATKVALLPLVVVAGTLTAEQIILISVTLAGLYAYSQTASRQESVIRLNNDVQQLSSQLGLSEEATQALRNGIEPLLTQRSWADAGSFINAVFNQLSASSSSFATAVQNVASLIQDATANAASSWARQQTQQAQLRLAVELTAQFQDALGAAQAGEPTMGFAAFHSLVQQAYGVYQQSWPERFTLNAAQSYLQAYNQALTLHAAAQAIANIQKQYAGIDSVQAFEDALLLNDRWYNAAASTDAYRQTAWLAGYEYILAARGQSLKAAVIDLTRQAQQQGSNPSLADKLAFAMQAVRNYAKTLDIQAHGFARQMGAGNTLRAAQALSASLAQQLAQLAPTSTVALKPLAINTNLTSAATLSTAQRHDILQTVQAYALAVHAMQTSIARNATPSAADAQALESARQALQTVLKKPAMQQFIRSSAIAATGGSPLPPENEALVRALLQMLVGAVLGGAQALLQEQELGVNAYDSKATPDNQKILCAMLINALLAALVPPGTSLAEVTASNAVFAGLQAQLEQIAGLEEKDSLKVAESAVWGGFTGAAFHKAMQVLRRATTGPSLQSVGNAGVVKADEIKPVTAMHMQTAGTTSSAQASPQIVPPLVSLLHDLLSLEPKTISNALAANVISHLNRASDGQKLLNKLGSLGTPGSRTVSGISAGESKLLLRSFDDALATLDKRRENSQYNLWRFKIELRLEGSSRDVLLANAEKYLNTESKKVYSEILYKIQSLEKNFLNTPDNSEEFIIKAIKSIKSNNNDLQSLQKTIKLKHHAGLIYFMLKYPGVNFNDKKSKKGIVAHFIASQLSIIRPEIDYIIAQRIPREHAERRGLFMEALLIEAGIEKNISKKIIESLPHSTKNP